MSYRVWHEKYRHYYNSALLEFVDEDLAYKYYEYVLRKSDVHKWKDSERQRTYNAEFAFEKRHPHVTKEMPIKECRKFVKRVLKSKLWEEFVAEKSGYGVYGKRKAVKNVKVVEMNSSRFSGVCYGSIIKLDASTGTNKYVILHELTHSAGFNKHDHRFRAALLRLVSRFLGREEAKGLKLSFRKKKLRYTKPTIKSPEAWLNAVKRAPIKIVA